MSMAFRVLIAGPSTLPSPSSRKIRSGSSLHCLRRAYVRQHQISVSSIVSWLRAKVLRLESSTTETTAGSLYAYGRQLYVITLSISLQPMRDEHEHERQLATIAYTSILQASRTVSCCSLRKLPNGPIALIRRQGESRPTGFSPSIISCCNRRRDSRSHCASCASGWKA